MGNRHLIALLCVLSGCGGSVFVEGGDEDPSDDDPVTYEACDPGRQRPCYPGPEATRGVGTCREGVEVCVASGEGYGACEGAVLPGAQDCASAQDETCGASAPSCTGATTWVFGATSGSSGGSDVAITPDGGAVVVGFVDGAVQFGTHTITTDVSSAFIAKLDREGNLDWWRIVESEERSGVAAVVVDAAGVITVAGGHERGAVLAGTPLSGAAGAFVARFEPNGDLIWARSYGYATPTQIAATPDGGFVVAGHLDKAVDLGTGTLPFAGKSDIFLLAITSDGVPLWARSFGSPESDRIHDLTVQATGQVLLAGSFDASLAFGDDQPPLKHGGGNDGYVALLDGEGQVQYVGHLVGSGHDIMNAVAPSPRGEMVVAGFLTSAEADTPTGARGAQGPASLYLGRLGPNGDAIDDLVLGDTESSIYPRDLVVDSAAQLSLLGLFRGQLDLGGGPQATAEGQESLFIAKRDLTLGHIWSHVFGDASLQRPRRLDQDPYGGMVITGNFRGRLDFGDGLVVPAGSGQGYHLFVARFAP